MKTRFVKWAGVRYKTPIDIPELLRNLSALLLCLSVLIALVILLQDKGTLRKDAEFLKQSNEDLRALVDADQEVSQCRNKLVSNVTNATTDFLLSLGKLINAASKPVGPERTEAIKVSIEHLDTMGAALNEARDARVLFEEDPTNCPVAVG